ncbi:hypothetical protein HGRIS_012332 [Hohenbuehelia grisea]|uniref:Uncharacterized protein n=1 Tax=Hohenbuehelia grisea TaxID=104357 RepID=A0ABR3IS06_9AGAR
MDARPSTGSRAIQFRAYVLCPDTLAALALVTTADIQELGILHPVLQNSPRRHSNWETFLRSAASLEGIDGEPRRLFRHLLNALPNSSKGPHKASHQQKHCFIHSLLGDRERPSIKVHIAKHDGNIEEAIRTSLAELGFKLVIRQREPENPKKYRNVVIVEKDSPLPNLNKPHRRGVYTVTPEEGFYFVQPDESVVFISLDKNTDVILELVVLRGVALDAHFSGPLYDWLLQVVDKACNVRRDCRPYHLGKMVQWGMNLGARHCHILGWAKSYCRKLSDSAMETHDKDAIGSMSLFWALSRAYLPTEVIDPIQEYLDESALPSMGTRNVASGAGFTIEVDDVKYEFSTAERAPPEGTATYGYSFPGHTDGSATNWTLSWIVDEWGNETGGNSYVDLSLKVVVLPASGTLIAHRPRGYHATTVAKGKGSGTAGFTVAFTERVAKAYAEFVASKGVGAVIPFSPAEH